MEYPQRKAYLRGEVSFEDFYESVAAAAGISYTNASTLPEIQAALASGDEHLNTIPLRQWDIRAAQTQSVVGRALQLHGDFYSLAGGVCVHKAAAKKAAREA